MSIEWTRKLFTSHYSDIFIQTEINLCKTISIRLWYHSKCRRFSHVRNNWKFAFFFAVDEITFWESNGCDLIYEWIPLWIIRHPRGSFFDPYKRERSFRNFCTPVTRERRSNPIFITSLFISWLCRRFILIDPLAHWFILHWRSASPIGRHSHNFIDLESVIRSNVYKLHSLIHKRRMNR